MKQLKTGSVLQLVESYRNEKDQPRQRLVVSLGGAQIPKEWWREIADRVEASLFQRPQQPHLAVEADVAEISRWVNFVANRIQRDGKWMQRKKAMRRVETVDGVLVDEVSHSSTTVLGPSLLGWHVWQRLGMDELLGVLGLNRAQRDCAAALVINRLCDPVSEHALPAWIAGSSLPDLVGEGLCSSGKDRFYRVGDRLLSNRADIEKHLRERQADLLNLDRTLLLYDLTNTHFEGVCAGNPKALRGKNKQKRNDCPQVVIGMVFDEFGFELVHQIFEGNMHDGKSLLRMIESLQALSRETGTLAEHSSPTIVMDSGVATKANRRLLREHGLGYIVAESRPGRKQWKDEFAKEGFVEISGREGKSPVQIRVLQADREADPGNTDHPYERLLLCKSFGRKQKESAIRSKAEERLLADMHKLRARVATGRLKAPEKIQRAIGRLLARHPRVARYYELRHDPQNSPQQITWHRKNDPYDQDDSLQGCYVLRSYKQAHSGEDLWRLYMTLTQAEEGFRQLKHDLGLRPNFHQKEARVDTHIFITVLAYQLLRHILFTLSCNGDHRSWSTLRRILSTHCYSTVSLPTRSGPVHHIRKPGRMDAAQEQIYSHFDIDWSALPTSHVIAESARAPRNL